MQSDWGEVAVRIRGDLYPKPYTPLCDNDEFDLRGLLMKRCALSCCSPPHSLPRTPLRPSAGTHFDGKSWWNYVKVLADDDMEGRETGSEGLRKAEAYIVEQLKSAGLEPAGSDGFYQPVKLISRQIDESGSSLALVRDGKTTAGAGRGRDVQHPRRSCAGS